MDSEPTQSTNACTPSSMVQPLPNELLLEIFLQLARIHPGSLSNLPRVCQHWHGVASAYKEVLWRHATLFAFPSAASSYLHHIQEADQKYSSEQGDRLSEIRTSNPVNWRAVFCIQTGWINGNALTMTLRSCRSPAMLMHDDLQMQGESTTDVTVTEHQELHDIANQQEGQYGLGQLDHEDYDTHRHHRHHHHHFQDHQSQGSSNVPGVTRESINVSILDESQFIRHDSASSRGLQLTLPPSLAHWTQPQDDTTVEDSISCNLCTYSDICIIPQAMICVRTHRDRTRPLIQILDWSMQQSVDLEDGVDNHRDLVSGMAVNEAGTLLVTCSIDGTVRVWDVNGHWRSTPGRDREEGARVIRTAKDGPPSNLNLVHMGSFAWKIKNLGLPIKCRRVLLGHVGWVNAVAIKDTIVVSGGSDHTVRVWDALSGRLLRLIPNLFLSRDVNLGVYAVAIHNNYNRNSDRNDADVTTRGQGWLIGSGTILEGYQIHDLATGKLLFDLDEPISSKDHVRFESLSYQQYATRVVITDTVIVTNSKLDGMLCVWNKVDGQFLYRIRVCPPTQQGQSQQTRRQESRHIPSLTNALNAIRGPWRTLSVAQRTNRMTTHGAAESSPPRPDGFMEERNEIHTFKSNASGSMLMCTLCDGRVALFEFGKRTASEQESSTCEVDATGHGFPMPIVPTPVHQQHQQQQRQLLNIHRCGTFAWVWTRDSRGNSRVVLVCEKAGIMV
ncbi:hypothetical protein EDD11_005817 [Mortierella claussenii]|nr:hypothetical protein EDD11_005817 [Mortierella claussenii]